MKAQFILSAEDITTLIESVFVKGTQAVERAKVIGVVPSILKGDRYVQRLAKIQIETIDDTFKWLCDR